MRQEPKALTLVLAFCLLAACGGSSGTSAGGAEGSVGTSLTSDAGFLGQVSESESAVSWAKQPFDTLDDLLVNQRYVYKGDETQDPEPITEAVVVGRVTEVTPGYGFPTSVPDDSRDYRLEFGAPEADWSTATVTVAVDEVVSASEGFDSSSSVDVGVRVLPVGGTYGSWKYDFASFKASLLNSGSTLFVLDNNRDSFTYDPGLMDLFMGGFWWCSIEGDDLRLMAVSGPESEALLGEVDTLSELRSAAERPTSVTEVSAAESGWLAG